MRLYFAYGSNMDRAAMRRRCPGAKPLGTAVLRDHRVFIGQEGWGSIRPARGSVVHGVVWQLTPRDIVALHNYELLYKGLYELSTVPVRVDGRHISTMTYVLRRREAGRPHPGYVRAVAAAARSWQMPEPYVRTLERLAA